MRRIDTAAKAFVLFLALGPELTGCAQDGNVNKQESGAIGGAVVGSQSGHGAVPFHDLRD